MDSSYPGIPADTDAALSFVFAEPATGGDRSLLGFDCGIGMDFLAQVKQKASELREADRVDFTFTISTSVSQHIDSTGFEKYEKEDGRTWRMDVLENHVNVEINQTVELGQNFIEIQVFSSV